MNGHHATPQHEQMPGNSKNTTAQQPQQHLAAELQMAKWVFNYADQLNRQLFSNTDAIVERVRAEFGKELDEIRKTMNAKVQQLQEENEALKNELQALVLVVNSNATDAKKKAKLGPSEGRSHECVLKSGKYNNETTLVDLSMNCWNIRDSQSSFVHEHTVTSCVDDFNAISTKLGYVKLGLDYSHAIKAYYAEFTINAMPAGKLLFIGLATANSSKRKQLRFLPNSYTLNNLGHVNLAEFFRPDIVPSGFGPGDTVGCGLITAKCEDCQHCFIYFTRNGQMLANPLEITPQCLELFPTVSFHGAGSQVSANFGQHPFQYAALPPAEHLRTASSGNCCCTKWD